MTKPKKKRLSTTVSLILVMVLATLYVLWRNASLNGGQKFAEPFKIAGNLYYVGANDVTSFLITGDKGHILIDGGYPGTPPLILASVEKLGFNVSDIKILISTHAHSDHAGGLQEIQDKTGAQLWVCEAESEVMSNGGAGDQTAGYLRFLTYLPFIGFPSPHVDHTFSEGDTIKLGSTKLIPMITPGHTSGTTTWTFKVKEDRQELNIVLVGGLTPPVALSIGDYPEIRENFEETFKRLKKLKPDIFLTTHARKFGRWKKYQKSLTLDNPVDAFIDPVGYIEYITQAEKVYNKVIQQ